MLNKTKDEKYFWTSLVVQWLNLCFPTAEAAVSVAGQETKILHAAQHGQKKKDEIYFQGLNCVVVFGH